jgi:hypothetical protein
MKRSHKDTGYAPRRFMLYIMSVAHARQVPVITVGKVVDKDGSDVVTYHNLILWEYLFEPLRQVIELFWCGTVL